MQIEPTPLTTLKCHCEKVSVEISHMPTKLNRCTCSICRRYGALWAYYTSTEINVSGPTDVYVWGDQMLRFHRCQNCGVLTHWTPMDEGSDRIAVNMQNMDPQRLTGTPIGDSHAQPEISRAK